MKKRGSGILLHLTSLPSIFGIGDMGPWAYRFGRFLLETGQRYWQVLPLNPTDTISGNSPYSSLSAFAGNPLLISPEYLVASGFLAKEDLVGVPSFPQDRCDFAAVIPAKKAILLRAFERFSAQKIEWHDYQAYCVRNDPWLDDFALFAVLKAHHEGKAWEEWENELRDRVPHALARARTSLYDEIEREKFFQYLFFRQWSALKGFCNDGGVRLIGDLPIYVNYDSADVWAHPSLFNLDREKRPLTVAGVPPDYFSKTGQRWGNPVYRWDHLRETGYQWWIDRIEHNLRLFDILRIDHFRGFVAYWEVASGEKTAVNGRWVEAPAVDFFTTLFRRFSVDSFMAEDLGLITPDVRQIMDRFGFPGMRVLQFAFGEDQPAHPYLPHNYVPNAIVYTGTHDNNTLRGWFEKEATPEERQRVFRYLGRAVSDAELPGEMIRLAMMSVANTAIVPAQDVLGLGEAARMNRPSTPSGNWEWRLHPEALTPSVSEFLSDITCTYGRKMEGP